MMHHVRALLAAALISLSASPSQSATLFQSIPDLTVAPVTNAFRSSCSGGFRAFDTFTFGSNANIQSVSFVVQASFFNDGGMS